MRAGADTLVKYCRLFVPSVFPKDHRTEQVEDLEKHAWLNLGNSN